MIKSRASTQLFPAVSAQLKMEIQKERESRASLEKQLEEATRLRGECCLVVTQMLWRVGSELQSLLRRMFTKLQLE